MTDEVVQPQIRRLSLYRQLSDVLKSKRKSLCHVSPPPTSNSTFAFGWNSTVPEVVSPLKEGLESASNSLVKQKSISCDDVAFLSSNEDQQAVDYKVEPNGLFESFF